MSIIRTSAKRSEILECGECRKTIYICDRCKEYFIPNMDCYCAKDKHYCENCKSGGKMKEPINQIQAVEIIKEELNDHTKAEILQEILEVLGFYNYAVRTEII